MKSTYTFLALPSPSRHFFTLHNKPGSRSKLNLPVFHIAGPSHLQPQILFQKFSETARSALEMVSDVATNATANSSFRVYLSTPKDKINVPRQATRSTQHAVGAHGGGLRPFDISALAMHRVVSCVMPQVILALQQQHGNCACPVSDTLDT